MSKGPHQLFANRLINALKEKGHIASRSPNGICIKALSEFAGASEQICRRYIRGDAVPDYEKIKQIAHKLDINPGWLLFGVEDCVSSKKQEIDDSLLHYILKQCHHLYPATQDSSEDYADFVLELVRDIREIDTSKENLEKIIDLAIGSLFLYQEKLNKKALEKSMGKWN